jgi:hypothetical protein
MAPTTNFLSRVRLFRYLIFAIFNAFVLLWTPLLISAASMDDYCLVPPYVKRDVKPNVLVIMDNSEEMGGPAYCAKDAVDPTICTDNYVPTNAYDGYFEFPNDQNGHNNQYYCYDGNKWVPKLYSTGIPVGCTTPAVYSGNLLNWATMSKYDVLQRILVGGISTSRQTNINTLVGSSTNWTKTLVYTDSIGNLRSCKIVVSGGSVEFRDVIPNSCGYLDATPRPVVAAAEAGIQYAAVRKPTEVEEIFPASSETAPVTPAQEEGAPAVMRQPRGLFQKVLGLFATVLNILTPSAEAAKTLAIKVGSPPSGTECVAYTHTFEAAGGTAPYSWSTAGTLPPGLTLSAVTGVLSGSPTASGTYSFTIRVTDAAAATDSRDIIIIIADNTVSITTLSPLQSGYVNSYYYVQLQAAGACGNFAWSLDPASPALPAGFSFLGSGDVGALLNVSPAVATMFTFKARVTDGSNNVATKDFTVTVNPAQVGFYVASGSPLTSAQQYSPYFIYIESAGGNGGTLGTYTWSIGPGTSCAANSLPAGLSFNSTTTAYFANISGTPSASGDFCFTITVKDSLANATSREFFLTVTPRPAVVRTSGSANIRICAGVKTATKDVNCDNVGSGTYNTIGYPCSATYPASCVMKSGIIDEFWSKARYGLLDFNQQAGNAIPNISNCIVTNPGAVPDPNFLTAIENAVPIDPTTTLVNAAYTAVNYYATGSGNCDPFANGTACTKNFNLIISSGVGADNPPVPSGGAASVYSDATNCGNANYKNLTKNTCYGFNNDLRPANTGRQYVSTYIVNPMGTLATPGYSPSDPTSTTGDILKQAALRGGGVYYEVTNSADLRAQLIQAFQDIIKRAAAGTAASVLASGEGSGANLIQAVFYPRRKFGDDEIAWIGRLSNFWYYVDPFFGNSAIRQDDGDRILNLLADGSPAHKDYIAELYFDSATETTRARRYLDANGDGVRDAVVPGTDIEFEKLGNLWEAGLELWKRSSARTIYANCDIDSNGDNVNDTTACLSGTGLMNFSASNRSALRRYLQATDDNEAEAIIRYVRGEDNPVVGGTTYSYRQRSVKVDLNNDGDTLDTVGGIAEGTPRVWKLGDVLNSTPKVSSWIPLNQFHLTYLDATYGNSSGTGGYIYSTGYRNRGMVFAGANDGMLHAFNLGKLQLEWTADEYDADGQNKTYEKARLTPPAAGTFGEEMWAFIPKNVLPYLTYQKENNYCHVYSVDLTPYVFDASINEPAGCTETNYWNCAKTEESWRTILVGGMRYGGACRKPGSNCGDAVGENPCVETPIADPTDATRGLGYSSYFAIDITDQNNPKLLWEWDGTVLTGGVYENHLGFSTSGPAIVKINARNISGGVSVADKTKNGRWFVIVGSGPTGPVGAGQQFMGSSDQPGRLFFIDLKKGPSPGNFWEYTSPVNNAFMGSMLNANEDTDLDYQDDVAYIPYVYKTGSPGTWTQGGIARLLTHEDLDGTDLSGSGTGNTALNPANWTVHTVIDGIGPVTSSVARLRNQRKGRLWLYGGTGRYYFEQGANTDDATSLRNIFGLKDPCYSLAGFDFSCAASTTSSFSDLVNVTDIANVPPDPDVAAFNGWFINLDAAGNYTYIENGTPIQRSYRSERVITDPLATTSGLVFFTTYKPYNDECSLGGKSFIWAAKYDTGGAPGALLKGKGLVQVSTGSIEQINLSTAFTEAGGRKTYSMEGVPPTAQGLSILSTPPPIKRLLHIRER